MAKRSKHRWSFFRAGGVDQVVLGSGRDVVRLRDLDQKLWVALACPTKGTELDEKTLAMIDSDQDGRVRVPEVLAAVEWTSQVLESLDLLFEKGESIPLSQFNDASDEGMMVLASAQRILTDQGKEDSEEITLADVQAMEQVFAATRFNGDGVVPADSADDEATKLAIEQVIASVGSVPDRSGKVGVDQKLADSFFEQAAALLAWDVEGQAEGVKPLGDATAAAAEALGGGADQARRLLRPLPNRGVRRPCRERCSIRARSSWRRSRPRSCRSTTRRGQAPAGEDRRRPAPVARRRAEPGLDRACRRVRQRRRDAALGRAQHAERGRLRGHRRQARAVSRLAGQDADGSGRRARRGADPRARRRRRPGQDRGADRGGCGARGRVRADRLGREGGPLSPRPGRAAAATSSTSPTSTAARARSSRPARCTSTAAPATCACTSTTRPSTPPWPACPRPTSPTATAREAPTRRRPSSRPSPPATSTT